MQQRPLCCTCADAARYPIRQGSSHAARSIASGRAARLYFAGQNDIKLIAGVAFVEQQLLRHTEQYSHESTADSDRCGNTTTSHHCVPSALLPCSVASACARRGAARASERGAKLSTRWNACALSRSKRKSDVSGRMCSRVRSEKNDKPCAAHSCDSCCTRPRGGHQPGRPRSPRASLLCYAHTAAHSHRLAAANVCMPLQPRRNTLQP